jgi:CheY-like chemotaxis protein/HPt (histidine-containing phosphotransfer) domain-containing protein
MGDWRTGGFHSPALSSGERHVSFTAPEGRVLAVDDNPGNLRVVKEFLGRTRLRVDTAAGGHECVRAVKNAMEEGYPCHVILMDYMMPDMNGIETLEKLREEIPGFDTPVIVLTADAIRGEREKFLSAGFAAYLSKPIARNDLENAIAALLPRDIVLAPAPETPDISKPDDKTEDGAGLSEYGISLSEGLKYASGDEALYREQAFIFTETSASARAAIEAKRDAGDWEEMTRLVHSLKGGAGYAGAEALRETALKIERACRAGDAEYASLALPLLFLEWDRACKGLDVFLRSSGGRRAEAHV